jgi:hypothetical protein
MGEPGLVDRARKLPTAGLGGGRAIWTIEVVENIGKD